jgi:hypothetical protein
MTGQHPSPLAVAAMGMINYGNCSLAFVKTLPPALSREKFIYQTFDEKFNPTIIFYYPAETESAFWVGR